MPTQRDPRMLAWPDLVWSHFSRPRFGNFEERLDAAAAAGLLDAGDGLKQERWGQYSLVRPDPQIIWPRPGRKPGAAWEKWDGFYHRSESGGGRWEFRRPLPDSWKISYGSLGLTFKIHPTSFKHTGLFLNIGAMLGAAQLNSTSRNQHALG
mgnify:CR=1 FL=1